MADGGRSLVLAQVVGIKDSNIVYPSCYQCYSKVYRRQDGDQELWQCLKCKMIHIETDIYQRYRLHLTVTDDSALCDITVFGTNIEPIFGCAASQYKKLLNGECDDTDGMLTRALEDVLLGRLFLFGFKSEPIKRRDSEKLFRTPVNLASVISRSKSKPTSNVNNQQSLPHLVAYQIIQVQESTRKNDLPTVAHVLKRRTQTTQVNPSGFHQRRSTSHGETLQKNCSLSESIFVGNSTSLLSNESIGNSTIKTSHTNSLEMTYGQLSVLLSCDRNSKSSLHAKLHAGSLNVLVKQGLTNESLLSTDPTIRRQGELRVGSEDSNESMAIELQRCSSQSYQAMDLCDINFDQSIALENEGLLEKNDWSNILDENEIESDIDVNLHTAQISNDGFDAHAFDETFDPNEGDEIGHVDCLSIKLDDNECGGVETQPPSKNDDGYFSKRSISVPEDLQKAGSVTSQHPLVVKDVGQTETTSNDTRMSFSDESECDSLLLLACDVDQRVNNISKEIVTKSPEKPLLEDNLCLKRVEVKSKKTATNLDEIEDESHSDPTSGHCQTSSEAHEMVDQEKSGSSVSQEEEMPFSEDLEIFLHEMTYSEEFPEEHAKNVQPEPEKVLKLKESQHHSEVKNDANSPIVVNQEPPSNPETIPATPVPRTEEHTRSSSQILQEEELPFSEDLDLFLQEMSFSQADRTQDHVQNIRSEVCAISSDQRLGKASERQYSSELNIDEIISAVPISKEHMAANPILAVNLGNVTSTVTVSTNFVPGDHRGGMPVKECTSSENGSEELFCTPRLSDQDSQKPDHSINSDCSSVTKSQSMDLFSSSELFADSYDAHDSEVSKHLDMDKSNFGFDIVSNASATSTLCKTAKASPTTTVLNDHKAPSRKSQGNVIQSGKSVCNTKTVHFPGSVFETKEIPHIDLKMKTPLPQGKTKRKSCLKQKVSFVPLTVSPLQGFHNSNANLILSSQADLFSPSPEIALKQQKTQALNSTLHSTPVTRNRKLFDKVIGESSFDSIFSSPDDSLDIITTSVKKLPKYGRFPSRRELLSKKMGSDRNKSKCVKTSNKNPMSDTVQKIDELKQSCDSLNLSDSLIEPSQPPTRKWSSKEPTTSGSQSFRRDIDQDTMPIGHTVEPSYSQSTMSEEEFGDAESADLFSDNSWEEDVDLCKKLF